MISRRPRPAGFFCADRSTRRLRREISCDLLQRLLATAWGLKDCEGAPVGARYQDLARGAFDDMHLSDGPFELVTVHGFKIARALF